MVNISNLAPVWIEVHVAHRLLHAQAALVESLAVSVDHVNKPDWSNYVKIRASNWLNVKKDTSDWSNVIRDTSDWSIELVTFGIKVQLTWRLLRLAVPLLAFPG